MATGAKYVIAFVVCLAASPARCDWLDDIWTGHPAPSMTVHADRGVSVTLPAAAYSNALAAGLTTKQIVAEFLGRYGPKLCSDILDFSVSHAALKVELRIISTPRHDDRFEVSGRQSLTIDYVPLSPGRCVTPRGDDVGGFGHR